MNDPAPLFTWLTHPLEPLVGSAVERLRRAADVRRVVVLPDVHLASDVCIGTVLATRQLIYPAAVGGDIGCGVLALPLNAEADTMADAKTAGEILGRLGGAVPSLRRNRRSLAPLPEALADLPLSHPILERKLREEGLLQLGTLGSGNHFVEIQSDLSAEGGLWLMIHSGSRCMGQAIRDHHLASAASAAGSSFRAIDADTAAGRAYLHDMAWARGFAEANRRAMAEAIVEILSPLIGAEADWRRSIGVDHNHVASEIHQGERFWVHRKGAMPAESGMDGCLPGSMGTLSYHVEGRGEEESLCSSAHGAGRSRSRQEARQTISARSLVQQMAGIWYDPRMANPLREEAPAAYKDVRAVLRAQRDLVRLTRTLRPVLNYKAR